MLRSELTVAVVGLAAFPAMMQASMATQLLKTDVDRCIARRLHVHDVGRAEDVKQSFDITNTDQEAFKGLQKFRQENTRSAEIAP